MDFTVTQSDFRNQQFILHDFSNCNLIEADFRNATLFCCDFQGSNLQRANFSNAVVITCDFRKALLSGANFRVRSERTCSFHDATLEGVIWPPDPNSIGNTDCRHNAQSPFLRCAIHPLGPCHSCLDFEAIEFGL